jgi:hypothetical protein
VPNSLWLWSPYPVPIGRKSMVSCHFLLTIYIIRLQLSCLPSFIDNTYTW